MGKSSFLVFSFVLVMGSTSLGYSAYLDLAWNANGEADLAGYRVYYGTSSGNYGSPHDVGLVTAYRLSGLTDGVRYYVAITAFDTSNNESTKSNEVNGLPKQLSSSSTSTVQPTTTTTTNPGTTTTSLASTTTPVTTTSAATTSIPGTSTIATTTPPVPTTIPPNTTSSTVPGAITTTTSTIQEDISSCEAPQKLVPLSVAASSELPPLFAKDNLIDGDPQTAWSTILSFFRKDASIILDLGGIKSISSLSMYASRIFGIDFLPSNIQLQVSNDNSTWETINTGAGYTSLQPPYADSWLINGHECRYLKVFITGRKSFFLFQLAQIAELEIYGCDPAGNLSLHADDNGAINQENSKNNTTLRLETTPRVLETGVPSKPGKPVIRFSQ